MIKSINYVSTGYQYYIVTNAQAGQVTYIDRAYALQASLPSEIAGADMIVTRNDDDAVSTSDHLHFTLSRPATVYIEYHNHAASLPAWAIGWRATGRTVNDGGAGIFNLYARNNPAGQVVLGGNCRGETGAASCYFVFAVSTPVVTMTGLNITTTNLTVTATGTNGWTPRLMFTTNLMTPDWQSAPGQSWQYASGNYTMMLEPDLHEIVFYRIMETNVP